MTISPLGTRGFLIKAGNRYGKVRFLSNTKDTVYRWEWTVEEQPAGRCVCAADATRAVIAVFDDDARYRRILNKPPRTEARGWVLREA